MGEPIINDFHADLEYSMDDELFNTFYKNQFAGLKQIKAEHSMEKQFKGIDKTLIFHSGYQVTIDEKKRRVDYGDILLELISNKATNRRGWLYTAQCDYIAYAVVPAKVIYFLPTTLLKMVWYENSKEWEGKYKKVEAINNGYVTISIPIPTSILLNTLKDKMINRFNL